MAEGEEGRSHPRKNGSARLILTVDSYRCNRTGPGGSQGRGSSCQPGREHFGLCWQCNAPLVKMLLCAFGSKTRETPLYSVRAHASNFHIRPKIISAQPLSTST